MNLADRNARVKALFAEAFQILEAKGQDYATTADGFASFKAIAAMTKQTPLIVLWCELGKHLVAIQELANKTQSLREHCCDAINYIAMLESMLHDSEPKSLIP